MADLLRSLTPHDLKPFGNIAQQVEHVAWTHGITADPEPIDAFAADVTRLCDQVVTFDRIEMLLIKLTRAGVINDGQSFTLHAAYLAQRRSEGDRVETSSDEMKAERDAVETAAKRALEARRASGQVLVYELDGWMVHEHPGGRIKRLAPTERFRATDFPHPSQKSSDAPTE